jgi:cobalt-zinc-cadmium efflux system outer membrane protein
VRVDLLQAGRDRDMAHRRLISWLPPGTPTFDGVAPPAGALPRLPNLLELTSRLDVAPALVQARLEVARRAALSQVELARRTQDLTVLVGSKRERSAGSLENGRQLVLGLSVPLPLFDRNAGAVLASLRRLDKAQDEQSAALVRQRLELEQAHARLATALQEAALIDADILPGARSAYDAATRGFEAGKFSYLEVLDAQRSLFNARQQSVKAAGEAHRAAADIAILTGIDL